MKGMSCVFFTLIVVCILDQSTEKYINRSKVSSHKVDFNVPPNDQLSPKDFGNKFYKIKRPFCNAFTGCGRKRSITDSQDLDPNDILPLYKALLLRPKYKLKQVMSM